MASQETKCMWVSSAAQAEGKGGAPNARTGWKALADLGATEERVCGETARLGVPGGWKARSEKEAQEEGVRPLSRRGKEC